MFKNGTKLLSTTGICVLSLNIGLYVGGYYVGGTQIILSEVCNDLFTGLYSKRIALASLKSHA